jgi:hypothetical protein
VRVLRRSTAAATPAAEPPQATPGGESSTDAPAPEARAGHAPPHPTGPGGLPGREAGQRTSGPTTTTPMIDAVRRWRAGLVDLVGGSSLADVGLLGEAVVDLSAAHPSGVAQLFAGRPTRLSNLVREPATFPTARRRARAVAVRSAEHAARYGLAPTYLAIGVATWTEQVDADGEPTGDRRSDLTALAEVASSTASASSPDVPADTGSVSSAVDDTDLDAPPLTTSIPVVSIARDDAPPRRTPPPVGEDVVGTRTVRAPVLLRPVTMTPRGDGETDYELTLEPTAEVNPLLVRALRARGAHLDAAALAQATFTAVGFVPDDVLTRIASVAAEQLDGVVIEQRVLVGTFVHPGQALVDDLDELAPALGRHEVVAALAGADLARQKVSGAELPEPRRGDADPARERGVGDLDPHQRHVVDVLGSGNHVFVDAPVGADVAGTVAAVVSEAAAAGRSVLYVTGHRRAADRLAQRLDELGLEGLSLDVTPRPTWREDMAQRLLAAMATEPEAVDTAGPAAVRDALIGARAQLTGYIDALHRQRAPWGVSAYDALQELARLTSERPAPSTTVRLASETTLALDDDRRRRLATDLERAATLGAFTLRPSATPWFGAHLLSMDEARDALARVRRLKEATLPQLRRQIAYTAEVTGLETSTTVRQWGAQLGMLAGMRSTLDVFHPMVFERTATDMVQATASRAWRTEQGVEMGWFTRRRLRKRARDMVRPGVRVPDLHSALVEVSAQRELWAEHSSRGGWPTLPEGLATIEDTYEAVRIDLAELEHVLAPTTHGGRLLDLDLDALGERLHQLVTDPEALETLPERTNLLRRAREAGVGELVDDLTTRRVPADRVATELDLAWWSSVFELMLGEEPVLAEQDGAGLDALARRFRDLDVRHLASLSQPVRVAARAHLGTAMREDRESAEALFAELIEGRMTSLRELVDRYGDVARRLRPVVLATPTLVPHLLPAHRTVDLVVLDAVEHVPTEVVMPALARGRQVVVVGDARAASGTAVAELAELLPHVSLVPRENLRDPELTRLLAGHGYGDLLRPAPVPRADVLVRLDVVDGTGMPDPTSGAVESTRAEVERVIEVSIEHALTRPEETLGIVTVTAAHADRIRDALLAEVRSNPALAPFFSGRRPEPVVVADITGVAGLQRDTILLSLGFGRTPHGRVLHRFGVLGSDGGGAMLVGALGATRRRLHVVSCFAAEALDPDRLRGEGPRLLRELLELAEKRSGVADQVALGNGVDVGPASDRLLCDLGERLWRLGYLVETDYGTGDGDRIPLAVGHPDLPGELLVAVLTDDAAYVAEPSVRVRDRQLAQRLERLGWTVTQVWSAAAFLDPDGEADRVRTLVQQVRDERVGTTGGVPVPPEVVVPVLPEDDAEVTDDVQHVVEPDVVEPDATDPDAGEPDAGEPDATDPDAGEPDAALERGDDGEPDPDEAR